MIWVIYIIVPLIAIAAFIGGAIVGVKWVTDIWFTFLDDEMGEMEAGELIDKFERWQR